MAKDFSKELNDVLLEGVDFYKMAELRIRTLEEKVELQEKLLMNTAKTLERTLDVLTSLGKTFDEEETGGEI